MSSTSDRPSVLFVCLGNICRSPTAEAVFRHKANEADLDVRIDSAGTHGYHIGKSPDKRSQEAGANRGYSFKGIRCRRVSDEDFEVFDYIVAMDNSNLEDLLDRADSAYHPKVKRLLDFTTHEDKEVPDPYYGGRKGFELVLDLIEDGCNNLIRQIQSA